MRVYLAGGEQAEVDDVPNEEPTKSEKLDCAEERVTEEISIDAEDSEEERADESCDEGSVAVDVAAVVVDNPEALAKANNAFDGLADAHAEAVDAVVLAVTTVARELNVGEVGLEFVKADRGANAEIAAEKAARDQRGVCLVPFNELANSFLSVAGALSVGDARREAQQKRKHLKSDSLHDQVCP